MMYKKVMVPLDGSKLSECSLEHVKAIASGCNVPEVILLRVVEPLSSNESSSLSQARGNLFTGKEHDKNVEGVYNQDDYSDNVSERMGQNRTEAEDYLSRVASQLIKEGISSRGEVVVGKAAEAILDHAEKNKVDLVVMTTHGRSGISRFAFGSVADRVARYSRVPILLVTPAACRMNLGS